MQQIEFTIFGNPVALKRHRTVRTKNFIRQYDPSFNDKQDFLAKTMEYRPEEPLKSALMVSLFFNIARPKSHYRTGKNAGVLKDNAPIACTKRPDIDNYVKFVMDALNGVFWIDDSQIFSLYSVKQYSETPSIIIKIAETNENEIKNYIEKYEGKNER